jgi:hypothetical protein
VDDPRDADVLVLWQDVRGDMAELCRMNKEYMHKPVVVVQHGRAATNDYLAPNKFPLMADKFCCWGIKDYERLERAGYKDKAVITGSPLVDFLDLRIEHDGKNITFCPVITQHEEPDNIETYWELKRIELKKSIQTLNKYKDRLRDEWNAWVVNPASATEGSIPYYNINREWRLIAKITNIHDKKLYFGDVLQTTPVNKNHLAHTVKLLQSTDCVVGIEEGTFQLLAMALDIPIVMVDGFKYKDYGGIDYSTVEMVKTPAVRRCLINELEKTVDEELANPSALAQERQQVVKSELWDGVGNPTDNILKTIEEVYNA